MADVSQTTPGDFAPGERVEHDKMGLGTVVAATSEGVMVEYDRTYPNRRGGRVPGQGLYDDGWFRTYPRKLQKAAADA